MEWLKKSCLFFKSFWLIIIIFLAFIFILFIFHSYWSHFHSGELSDKTSDWANFGSYFGGTLSPILAFFSFLALCYTINLQNKQLQRTDEQLAQNKLALEQNAKALELNNQELNNSTEQLKLSAKAQLEMEKTQRIQRFEGLFTYMANELSEIQTNLSGLSAKDIIQNSQGSIYKHTEVRNKLRSDINHSRFFIYLYQILNLIDIQDEKIIPFLDKKRYSNIIRSSLDNSIIQLCFLNCLVIDNDDNDFQKYKKILEKYKFFEHMYIHYKNIFDIYNFNYVAIGLLCIYKKRAFGDSDYLRKAIIDIIEKKIYYKHNSYKWQDLNYHRNLTFSYDCNKKAITFKETTIKDIFATFDLKVCKNIFSRHENTGSSIQFREINFVFTNKEFRLEISFCNNFNDFQSVGGIGEIFLKITDKKTKYRTEFEYVKI